jgi:16S rRNA (adenine1518-N6/adenine1519-N6)-dimethyltransferase
MELAKKSLGQHWLKDVPTLELICQAAEIKPDDTILEIGPGQGDLTTLLLSKANKVFAVELDELLAKKLPAHPKLTVIQGDILKFDLTTLPPGYKIVANIPYYLTSNLIRVLSESPNPPKKMVLLVQKEVAERIAAQPGQMSLLSVSSQLYFQPKLGPVIMAELFEPKPKVDSQVIILDYRPKPLFENLDTKTFFILVKAGFSGRRKKLRSSLAAGLQIEKPKADELIKSAGIKADLRAQSLSLQEWHRLYLAYI